MKKILLFVLLPFVLPLCNISAADNRISSQDNLPPLQIYGSVGGSMWTTPLYMPDGTATPTMTGRELQAGVSYAFGIYSVGLMYSEHHAPYSYMGVDCYADIDYIALMLGMRGKVSEHWALNYVIGIGRAQYSDGIVDYGEESKSGLGVHYSLGVDYLLTRHIAVGADLQYLVVNLGKSTPDAEYADGVKRLGVSVGIKLYF